MCLEAGKPVPGLRRQDAGTPLLCRARRKWLVKGRVHVLLPSHAQCSSGYFCTSIDELSRLDQLGQTA